MSTANILSRLATRFTKGISDDREHPDLLTRDIGGHKRNNQPYISGYFYVMFGLPDKLFGTDGGEDIVKISSQWLHSTCESFTPHSSTITKVDVMGMGGIGSSYAANRITSREFTTAHREYQNMPVTNIINKWASGLFDPFVGTSPLEGKHIIPQNYKGWCAVAQIKPTGAHGKDLAVEDIEECYIYSGVFPTNVPTDTVSSADITGNDTVQVQITWSFDGHPATSSEPGITDTVVKLFNSMNMLTGEGADGGGTFERYNNVAQKSEQWQGVEKDEQSTSVVVSS